MITFLIFSLQLVLLTISFSYSSGGVCTCGEKTFGYDDGLWCCKSSEGYCTTDNTYGAGKGIGMLYVKCILEEQEGCSAVHYSYCFMQCVPSITDGVHRNENFEEIIPVFSTFSNFFKQNKKKIIKAILCNFSMRFLKYF